jgi:hypothetical protein
MINGHRQKIKHGIAKVMTSFVSDYVFDVKGVVELISICAACIFLTTQVIQKRRWS